jgi:hypothetical protein
MRIVGLFLLACVSTCVGGCSTQPPEAPPAVTGQPDFRLDVSIGEIMQAMVMPTGDTIWGAVTPGLKENEFDGPKTTEDWAKLRHQAVILGEAANLILMNGRRAQAPSTDSNQPVDPNALAPEKIEALIKQENIQWTSLAHAMHDSAMAVVKAVDAKSAQGVFDAGNTLSETCGNCHKQFWLPAPKAAAGSF